MAAADRVRLVEFFKAAGDESRLKILGLVAHGESSVKELAEKLGLREPTVSHHLARLARIGLVAMRVDGNVHWYRLDLTALHGLARSLDTVAQVKELAADVDADAFDRKVLDTFIQRDRIMEIPAARKKRQVVLRWLVARFEEGRKYTQPEINEVISRHHEDTATLRRELIASKLMHREGRSYWRLPVAG